MEGRRDESRWKKKQMLEWTNWYFLEMSSRSIRPKLRSWGDNGSIFPRPVKRMIPPLKQESTGKWGQILKNYHIHLGSRGGIIFILNYSRDPGNFQLVNINYKLNLLVESNHDSIIWKPVFYIKCTWNLFLNVSSLTLNKLFSY